MWKDCQEKLLTRFKVPVLKPTQVGKEKIQRCARKPSLRNSAKYIRNLGKRMSVDGERCTSGAVDRGSKEAQATVKQKHRCLQNRNMKYKC